MKKSLSTLILLTSFLMPSHGKLPAFDEPPLIGCFATREYDRYTLRINNDAMITIHPHMGPKGEAPSYYKISQILSFLETMKNGRVRKHAILPDSLTTEDEKSTRFSEATIEGEATGQIKFRYAITNKRGELTLQPELLNTEELAGRDIKMVVETRMSPRYRLLDTMDDKEKEQITQRIEETTVTFHPADGSKAKKHTETYAKVINTDTCAQINGTEGFQSIVTRGYFKHRSMCLLSLDSEGPNAALYLQHLGRKGDTPLYRAHAFQWIADVSSKPDAVQQLQLNLEED